MSMLDTPESGSESDIRPKFKILPDRDKLEALSEFAAGAGHEINNPLATIIGRAQLLLKDERDPQRRQMLMAIGAQAYRIRDMIGDTMLYGRPPLPELSNVNLVEIVNKLIDKQSDELASEHSSVRVEITDSILLRADSTQLAIVFNELIRNSRQALQPDGGELRITAVVKSGLATIELTDDGKGMTELERQHAFDPFFSGRQAGRGLGFGLSKCLRIVEQHQGQIEIESSASGPTTVRIIWPIGN